jgi:ankyrin repeat protein
VDVLLEAGADPNLDADSDHSFGSTPLIWAAYGARLEMVRSLLAHGADPHVRSGRNQLTPLFAAAAGGDPEIVRLLLSQGLDASDTDLSGLTPLHWGARFPEVARILVANGADVNARDRSGVTPVMWLTSDRDLDRVDVVESLRLLLAAGADLHARSTGGVTPLISAVQSEDPVAVRALLEAGADVNVQDWAGQTSLAIVREHRQKRRAGFVSMLVRMFSSKFREREKAELAALDEVELLLAEAGGQP